MWVVILFLVLEDPSRHLFCCTFSITNELCISSMFSIMQVHSSRLSTQHYVLWCRRHSHGLVEMIILSHYVCNYVAVEVNCTCVMDWLNTTPSIHNYKGEDLFHIILQDYSTPSGTVNRTRMRILCYLVIRQLVFHILLDYSTPSRTVYTARMRIVRVFDC
jgi:hypothetical protein